jgi:hypothetical protein
MTGSPAWPSYQTGPKDSIFAIGVISINYARLEFAAQGMFINILGMTMNVGHFVYARLGPEMRDAMMRQALPFRGWPQNVGELAFHFIEANKICYENRNKLMHSNIMVGSERTIVLYKTDRSGKTTLANPTLKELRQVADDMNTYVDFGLWLSNQIAWTLLGMKPQPGDRAYESWPSKPPLPIPLEYTSDPSPIRSLD